MQSLETDNVPKILDARLKKFDTGPSRGELASRLSDAAAALAELGLKRF